MGNTPSNGITHEFQSIDRRILDLAGGLGELGPLRYEGLGPQREGRGPCEGLGSDAELERLMSLRGNVKCEAHSMLQYKSIARDMLAFLASPAYLPIFSIREHASGLIADMQSVRLSLPILEALDYFREFDPYSYRHFLMVFFLSALLAKDLVADQDEHVRLVATGPSHDIGKLCVPLRILKKTTPITRREKAIIDNHSHAGYVILDYYLGQDGALSSRVARDHHERRDGSGKPRGILQDDLMVEIIAVCDVYDALISPRPYRAGPYDNRAAIEEITRMAGSGIFRWDVVRALVAHNRRSKPRSAECIVSTEERGVPPPNNLYGILADD